MKDFKWTFCHAKYLFHNGGLDRILQERKKGGNAPQPPPLEAEGGVSGQGWIAPPPFPSLVDPQGGSKIRFGVGVQGGQ